MEKDKDNVYNEYIKESKLQMQQHQTSDNEDEAYFHYVAEATTEEEQLKDGTTREVMHFHPFLAPYKVAVLPLMKKYHSEKAKEVYQMLAKNFMTTYDETGNIGKRYRRQDVAGTPFCITIDEETLNNNTVTIRDRDTMEQVTLPLDEVVSYIEERIKF